ncbi:MAG: hypothetical protein LBI43_01965 [Streptococcaceae bacterium]|jgi:hypothetical protein|nr:hypothetical protein [Streptococcaceae bacterium]
MTFLTKALRRVLIALFGAATVIMLVQPFSNVGFVEPLSVLIFAVGLFFVLRFCYQKLSVWEVKRLKLLLWGLFIVFIGVQILWVNLAHPELFGDPWHVQMQATRLARGDTNWDIWIRMYPNLAPLVALDLAFIKVSSFLHVSYYAIYFSFNILVNTAIWGVVARFLWRKKAVLGVMAMGLILVMPYSNDFLVAVGYSDGLAILCLVAMVTLFDRAFARRQARIWEVVVFGMLFVIGFLMRPNVVVILVALIILGLMAWVRRSEFSSLWKTCLLFLLAGIAGIALAVGAGKAIDQGLHFDTSQGLPTLHWVYMGLNERNAGEYNAVDRDYSLYHRGYPTAKAADEAGIVERLKSENVSIVGLWFAKFATLWSEGTMQTTTDYQYFNETYNWAFGPSWLIQNVGAINILLQTYAKALVGVLLFAIFYNVWRLKRDLLSSWGLALLGIMGVSLFHTLLWEVKPRYQLMTLGLLVIAAVWSFEGIFAKESQFTLFEKRRKVLRVGLIVSSIVSLGLMATVMQLQPKQAIVVAAQQHPTDLYGYAADDLTLSPGESLSQTVVLPAAADHLNLSTGTTANMTLRIKKLSGTVVPFELPKDWTKPINPSFGALAESRPTQNLDVSLSAGTYQLVVTNTSGKRASIEAVLDTTTLDLPKKQLIKLPDGQTASFDYIFSQTEKEVKYPVLLIVLFACLMLLVNLLVGVL